MAAITEVPEPSLVPETQRSSAELEEEISRAKEKVSQLIAERSVLTSHVLSSSIGSSLLAASTSHSLPVPQRARLSKLLDDHRRKNTAETYRLAAGVTLFEAKDPDPAAVDGGRVIGVRFERFSLASKTFLVPWYLLLNRPFCGMEQSKGSDDNDDGGALRVHRHTIPPCIPLAALVEAYLSAPASTTNEYRERAGSNNEGENEKVSRQDLDGLVKELRVQLADYQRRQDAIEMLKENNPHVKEAKAMNTELTDILMRDDDDTELRLRINNKGEIQSVIAIGATGRRDRVLERRVERQKSIDGLKLLMPA